MSMHVILWEGTLFSVIFLSHSEEESKTVGEIEFQKHFHDYLFLFHVKQFHHITFQFNFVSSLPLPLLKTCLVFSIKTEPFDVGHIREASWKWLLVLCCIHTSESHVRVCCFWVMSQLFSEISFTLTTFKGRKIIFLLLPAGAKTHQGNNQGRHPYHPYHQIRISNNVYIYSFYPRTVVNWNSLTINASVNSLVKFKWLWHHQLSSHCFSPFYDNYTGNICIDLTIFITFHIRNTRFYFHFY